MIGCTMRATGCLNVNFALAVGADLGGGSFLDRPDRLFNAVTQTVDHLYHQEQDDSNNEEVDNCHNKCTIVNGQLLFQHGDAVSIHDGLAQDNLKGAEILLEDTAKIQPVHLCSVFSNLLDNARRAAAVCTAKERKIIVKAAQKGDYLHIKVENTSAFPEKRKKTADGHGYGQEILKDIAMQYNGDFYTDWKDGIYTAVISMENTIIEEKPPR